jgi:acetate---CoA ligase (ADP-forming) subunit beta
MSRPSGGPADVASPPVSHTLSEARSKALLAPFGVPFPDELTAADPDDAVAAAERFGYPVVAKLNGDRIAHKTERGLVRLALSDAGAVRQAATELLGAATPDDGEVSVLVAPMLRATRELIVGLTRDPQFGMTVMVGVGGVLAEALADVSVRLVPIDQVDAADMLDSLDAQALLGPFRGEPAIDRNAVADVLLALSRLALDHPEVVSVDLNPLLVVDGRPVAVDALVEVWG